MCAQHNNVATEELHPRSPRQCRFIYKMESSVSKFAGERMYAELYFLTCAAPDACLKLWDISKPDACVNKFVGHSEGVNDLAWTFDGRYIASVGDDTIIKIWDVERVLYQVIFNMFKQGTCIKNIKGHTNYIFCINFSPNSNQIGTQKLATIYYF